MSIQTLTTILTDPATSTAHLEAASDVARAYDAHLHVLAVGVGYAYPGAVSVALEAVPVPTGFDEGADRAAEIAETATSALARQDIRWDVDPVVTLMPNTGPDIINHSRYSDLVIQHRIANPSFKEQNGKLAEIVLFDADSPLLVLPDAVQFAAPAQKIMVAWDDSLPALRAARLALPLLRQAGNVYVAIIDPAKDSPDRSDPGGAFAQFLARHGVRTEVIVMNRTDDTIAKTLERRAQELNCDLIVMGAYGHTRLRQALFGGTTRYMLENAQVPVFLAH